MKVRPMILRFFSGRFAGQVVEELVFSVGADHLDAHVLGEHGHHLLAFVQAQQAVVDEHAGQLVADGLVQQRGNHRRIHAAGQAEQHVVGADLGADLGDGVFSDFRRGPQGFTAADVEDEARQDAAALLGVGHFRVELHAVVTTLVVEHAGDRAARGAGQDVKSSGILVTLSPWLIHTSRPNRPSASMWSSMPSSRRLLPTTSTRA
jgi:hypothetical protein